MDNAFVVGDLLEYSYMPSIRRGIVKVKAEVIELYEGLYCAGVPEMSIRFSYAGDLIVEHGIRRDAVNVRRLNGREGAL